ncbi:MAG: hypothetical protein JST08_19915 [Actinobacteria bacterium]|nr:hypothetical protein [Actinomycetota bacterium]
MASNPTVDQSAQRAGHPRWALALVVLGGVLTFAAIFSIWINRQALNTDNWVSTSNKVLANEDIRHRLSEYLTEQLFAKVDLSEELQGALPPRLAPLAGPAAGALEGAAPRVAERILASAPFEAIWETSNRTAHEALLRILNGETGPIAAQRDKVVLELRPAVKRLGERFGIGLTGERIPPGAGNITILEGGELKTAQDIASAVRELPIVLTLLVVACFAGAAFLAGPRRREALRSIGFAFAAAGLLVLALRGFAGSMVVDSLTRVSSAEPAVEAVWDIATSLLVTVAVSAIAFGVILLLAAWAAGPTRPAVALRRLARPYAERGLVPIYGAAFVIFLALIAWAPIAAFHKPLGVLIFAVLVAAGTELWRRQVLAEAPADAGQPAPPGPPGPGDAAAPPRS